MTNRFWHGSICVLGDDILHLRWLERDIPRPLPKSPSSVYRLDPFTQGVAFGLVLRAVGSLDFEREHLAAGQSDKEVGNIPTARAGPHVVNLKSKMIVLRIGDHLIAALEDNPVRIIAHRPDKRTVEEYDRKEIQAREDHSLNSGEPVIFLEIMQGDASAFEEDLEIRGVRIGSHRILRATSPAIPNAIAATLLDLQKRTGQIAHAYFGWTEGNPIGYVLRYMFLGEGDTAPVTREVLRRAVRKQEERPRIHVG